MSPPVAPTSVASLLESYKARFWEDPYLSAFFIPLVTLKWKFWVIALTSVSPEYPIETKLNDLFISLWGNYETLRTTFSAATFWPLSHYIFALVAAYIYVAKWPKYRGKLDRQKIENEVISKHDLSIYLSSGVLDIQTAKALATVFAQAIEVLGPDKLSRSSFRDRMLDIKQAAKNRYGPEDARAIHQAFDVIETLNCYDRNLASLISNPEQRMKAMELIHQTLK